MSSGTEADPPSIRILIVDDHPAVRQGLSLLLVTEGVSVVAEAGKRAEAVSLARDLRPDLASVDISLEGEDGLLVVSDLSALDVPSLVYSMHADARHVAAAFSAGALGYVTKAEFGTVIVDGVRAVAARGRFVSPKAATALAESVGGLRIEDAFLRLSSKEQEVYRLVGRGAGTQEIAVAMKISTHTVESYFARIQAKLGLFGMHGLRRHAIEHARAR